jgi:hypothetical protein
MVPPGTGEALNEYETRAPSSACAGSTNLTRGFAFASEAPARATTVAIMSDSGEIRWPPLGRNR